MPVPLSELGTIRRSKQNSEWKAFSPCAIYLGSTKWFQLEKNFKIQIWLFNETREFSELYSSGFLKTRIRAFFHMWPAQEGGAIYCKCLSDAIQPPRSKREFIQEDLVTSSRKMPPHWMYTDQSPRPETGMSCLANRKQINRWGREILASPEQIQQCSLWGWPLRQESRTDMLPSVS